MSIVANGLSLHDQSVVLAVVARSIPFRSTATRCQSAHDQTATRAILDSRIVRQAYLPTQAALRMRQFHITSWLHLMEDDICTSEWSEQHAQSDVSLHLSCSESLSSKRCVGPAKNRGNMGRTNESRYRRTCSQNDVEKRRDAAILCSYVDVVESKARTGSLQYRSTT
jgi:hypothetical protein